MPLSVAVRAHPQVDSIPKIYEYVEVMPVFPGDLRAYVSEKLEYPQYAWDRNIAGKVLVHFWVDSTGFTDSITVIGSVSPSLDSEAVRVVKEMPRWRPGTQNGWPVRVHFTLPLVFSKPGVKPMPTKMDTTTIAGTPSTKGKIDGDPPRFPRSSQFIATHLVYPQKAREKGIEGGVMIEFLVEPSGKVSEYHIDRSTNAVFNDEAIRVAAMMAKKKWLPGTVKGKPSRYRLVLPFIFQLQ